MFRTDTKKLYEEVTRGYNQLKSAKNSEERMALANYIGNLYRDISAVEDSCVHIKEKTIFGSRKNHQKFFKKLDLYEVKMLENFVLQKDFHADYFRTVLQGVEENFELIPDAERDKNTLLSREEYYAIFSEFMKSIKQSDLFDKFYKEGKIYSTVSDDNEKALGNTEYNPISGETNIFISDFNYDIHSMFTLAHEFGHAYDLSKFNESVENYNRYFYQSFYGEVFSKLFERLFVEYLIKNNILKNEAKDKLFEMELINYGYLLGSYILSLLDDKYLLANSYPYFSSEKIFELVKDSFIDEDYIKNFIDGSPYFDVLEDCRYAYGDILSMFLKIQIDNYGFDNDLIDEIFKFRSELFDSSMIDKYNLNPNRYNRLHRKEIKLSKK